VDTLALEAGPHLTPDGIVAAWLDAGRNEVAAGWFRQDGERIREDAIAPVETLLLEGSALPQGALIYCGEAAYARRCVIRDPATARDPSRPLVVAPWTPANRLWRLAAEGARRVYRGDGDDLAALQPYYLRMPTIGAPRQRDQVRQGRPPSA
jgi:tRNA A37 threonylcarbamoyladenosine modification protein TsaB